ncbi:DUF427 domain-containing protein [Microbacterium hominis]|uniref:DUF427 domain-containing protein n=1 Tax=Microbacterium hominis TaxID=162426 RepID=A0A134DHD3_9MICO|nr:MULTISPECIES: DUF427 domain-containing protein [Microbacterium]AUG28321.1 DUF427 domain-containing protein [Microbacterium hominis]KXC05950.1 hypothetical protein MhomT_08325 [Microbacterium hominis]QRY39820.1 DUF427 domain-containing protein [Microbacterium hominis]
MPRPLPETPAPGQESVWDYPRPPRVEPVAARVTIRLGGELIADTRDAVRVLETSHPPVYYLPIADFAPGALVDAEGSSFCEFKGAARYLDVVGGGLTRPGAAWNYPQPSAGYGILRDRVAVYAAPMDACTVDGEVVTPQPGGFYGGWVTANVVGPFKGVPGSMGW